MEELLLRRNVLGGKVWGIMGHYGALWGVFKRDISKSIQAYPIVPHNAPFSLKHPLYLESIFLFFTDVIL